MLYLFAALFLAFCIHQFFSANLNDKPFVLLVSLVGIYYGFAAPLYWIIIEGGYFLGVDWSDELERSCIVILGSTAFLILCTRFLNLLLEAVNSREIIEHQSFNNDWYNQKILLIILLLGTCGLAYVLAFVLAGGDPDGGDPFLRIAYQFGDLLIPCLIFLYAIDRRSSWVKGAIAVFVFYCVTIGFRYKLVLLFLPLMSGVLIEGYRLRGKRGLVSALYRSAIVVLALGVLFSFMTITRQKFGGIDLTSLSDGNSQDILYGFFAEGNTIFALSAILREYPDKGEIIGLLPITDAIQDFLPRFLFPGRVTGIYVDSVLAGLLVPQAMTSGTAYPYQGELLMMYGYTGLIVGTIGIAALYVQLRNSNRLVSAPVEASSFGYGLLAIFFGYYFFSRGYFSQGLKGFLFIVLPYFLLLRSRHASSRF